MAKDMKKSRRHTMTVLTGMIILGKYTLVRRFELAMRELLDSLNEVEKNCQGSVAAQTSKTRGTPSGKGALNNLPMNHMAKIVNKGRNTLHKTPSAVCL